MTVKQMLGNMTQKELAHWIAYFRIENAEHEREKQERHEKQENGKVTINQVSDEASQLQKDQQMMMQLLALSGQSEK